MITQRIMFAGAGLVLILLAGCDKPTGPDDEVARPPALAESARIVSLSPAITRTLIDLRLESSIIGRTQHCPVSSPRVPIVGDLMNVNLEHMVRLSPTHVLVQPPEQGVDENLLRAAHSHGWHLHKWRLNDLDDIQTLLHELPGALFAPGTQALTKSSARAVELNNQMEAALTAGTAPVFRGRTLLLYSNDPPSVFGKDTYLDGVLSALGGTNATPARHWVTYSIEDIVRLNPEAIIVVRPSTSANIADLLGPIWELEIAAMMERRLAVLNHPDSYLPSTGVIGVAEQMRTILESFGERP